MLIKVECEGMIKEDIVDCVELIKRLDYLCGTTMKVNGIEIEIYPSINNNAEEIYQDYLDDLYSVEAMRLAGEVEC